MEIRVLRYFLAVAREESISGAAETLHITQPTLSRQIMELEKDLGTTLLIRKQRNRRIMLTDEGLLLRKRAEEIIALTDKTEAEFNAKDEIVSGDIYIGAGETDAMRLIARAAKDLQQDYPHIHYHLHSGNAEDVTEKLDKGLLDFGILIEPVNKMKYDYIKIPATDTWGLLMRKDSPYADLDYISPEDLSKLQLLCSRQSMVQNEISGWLGSEFDKLNIIATYNLIYNASLMVEEGLGYALTLDKLVNTSGSSNLCFRPLKPPLEVGLVVVWKKYQVFTKAAELFFKKIKEEF